MIYLIHLSSCQKKEIILSQICHSSAKMKL